VARAMAVGGAEAVGGALPLPEALLLLESAAVALACAGCPGR
jgi:hypothetical protein